MTQISDLEFSLMYNDSDIEVKINYENSSFFCQDVIIDAS